MKRLIVVFVGACAAMALFACMPDIGPFFKLIGRPEGEAAFRTGQLGLITPALNKDYELIAFRYLSGLTLDGTDAINATHPQSISVIDVETLGPRAWTTARREISDPPAPANYIDPYRVDRSSSIYVFYQNCLDDAFETAARTLKDRQQRYASQAAFQSWVRAQDQVFTNCSADHPTYPEEPPSDVPQLVRADRCYQIAASHFYAEDLDGAQRLFEGIAVDQNSPWQKTSAYMVGRTLLREASLQKKSGAAEQAREQFQKIADDPSAGSLRDSARGLLEHLNAIDHPAEMLQSLSNQLMARRPPLSFSDRIQEARYVLTVSSFHQALAQPDIPEPFDWVQTLESGDADHAVERWRARHSLPWLTVALIHSNGKDASAPELIDEADRLAATSPGFGTATYNAVRLRMERGETDEPRRELDRLLARAGNQPASLENGWRAERMRLATSFDNFLRWAPRKPIYASNMTADPNGDSPVLAQDSAFILNYRVPVSKLAEAARSPRLPQWSAEDVAIAAWTRAFMLQDGAAMSAMAPILEKAHRDWAGQLIPPSGKDLDAWRFRTALLISHHREFDPLVPVDYRKHMDWPSWWCAVMPPANTNLPGMREDTVAWRLPVIFEPAETVISKPERRAAEDELDGLDEIGSAQSLISPIILGWAKSHPEDPLVPEALHRVVMVVRYGCHADPANGEISKAAFDLLHKRYPKSDWTARTPYWFK